MSIRNFRPTPFGLALIVGLLLAGLMVSARITLAYQADQRVREREESQVQHGIQGWVNQTEERFVGNTIWDEAVQKLGVRFDRAWAQANVGQYFHDVAGADMAFVVDATGQPLYGMHDGHDAQLSDYRHVSLAAQPLIAKVRAMERLARRRPGKPPFKAIISKAIQASDLRVIDGVPGVVTASLVQPDVGRIVLAGPAPIIISVSPFDADFLLKFGDRFLLDGLHFHLDSAERQEPNEASVLLTDPENRVVGRMDWTPQTPGLTMVRRSMPILLACLGALTLLGAWLFARASRAVAALSESESRAVYIAYHDSMTDLPNRAALIKRIDQALKGQQLNGTCCGLLALDVDRFKLVNDTYGHAAGDELLRLVVVRLTTACPEATMVARLGGDEFTILQAPTSLDALEAMAQRIVAALEAPFELTCGRAFVGISVGIAVAADGMADAAELLAQADLAMYRAKDTGRARYCVFEPEMDAAVKSRRAIERDLRHALETGGLTLAYQPQVDAQGLVTGVEALLRWMHPERGAISPAYFVSVAEESGLMDALGTFVLRQAFTDSHRWPALKMAVNISAVQLRAADFVDQVLEIVRETGARPERIELEITEGVLLADDDSTQATLLRLKALGFSIALDDFGTGYSSLAYLRRFPIDKIKIDRSFVINLGIEKQSDAVVSAIVKLAKALHLSVIAEGVETEVQAAELRRIGCRDIQGYFYGKPMAADRLDAFLATRESSAEIAA